MTELERIALQLALLTATVAQMLTHIDSLEHDLHDLRDIWRGCACFGTPSQTEVP